MVTVIVAADLRLITAASGSRATLDVVVGGASGARLVSQAGSERAIHRDEDPRTSRTRSQRPEPSSCLKTKRAFSLKRACSSYPQVEVAHSAISGRRADAAGARSVQLTVAGRAMGGEWQVARPSCAWRRCPGTRARSARALGRARPRPRRPRRRGSSRRDRGPSGRRAARSRTPPASAAASTCPSSAAGRGSPRERRDARASA